MMPVHPGMFQKFTRLRPSQKIGFFDKVIVFTVDFAWTWRSRRARNRINEFRSLPESVDQSRFARAGRRGNDKQDPVAPEFLIQDFESARGFFRARPCRQRYAEKWRHRSPWLPRCSARGKF